MNDINEMVKDWSNSEIWIWLHFTRHIHKFPNVACKECADYGICGKQSSPRACADEAETLPRIEFVEG